MGREHHGVKYDDFQLAPGEFITHVNGRAGDLIDQLTFKTNMGRKKKIGKSKGGHKFRLFKHGHVVKGF